MKKYGLIKKSICVLAAASCMISGCGQAEDYRPQGYGEEEVTPPDVSGNTTRPEENYDPGLMPIGERYELDGKMESYLTGEWVDTEIATRRPMAVMIPNNRNALPQYGVSFADVIIEAPMESCSCTRLMGIFQNYDGLEYIEPIRSSRHYFLLEALSYDAIYCNWGLAVPYVGPLINSDYVDNISAPVAGVNVTANEAFSRDKDRQLMGYSLEYTGIMTMDGYNAAVERLGYDTTYPTDNYTFPLLFATDAHRAEYEDYPEVTQIYPGGNHNQTSANGYQELNPYFIYNEEDQLYYRYQNEQPHMDEYNGTQLAVTNVIIKYVSGNRLDDSGYMNFDTYGYGDGMLFTNGKMVKLKWKREIPFNDDLSYGDGVYEQTRYFDAETGEELILNKGKTWICLVWKNYDTYTDLK